MRATVRCPGSCGELVQGTTEGINFLVTCPVTVYSQVSVSLSTAQDDSTQAQVKTREAVRRTLQRLALPYQNVTVRVETKLPSGKGMASSSADISAACLATALATGHELSLEEICGIALDIEPTDGIFLPGITLIDHVTGKLRRGLGDPPALHIAIFDVGGEVDTINFNQRTDLAELNLAKEAEVLQALQLVEQGLLTGDCSMIGKGATISAMANQPILYKPSLEGIIQLSETFGALGVNVAHSGTVMGVLFAPEVGLMLIDECTQSICRNFPEIRYFQTAKLTSGGLSVVEES